MLTWDSLVLQAERVAGQMVEERPRNDGQALALVVLRADERMRELERRIGELERGGTSCKWLFV